MNSENIKLLNESGLEICDIFEMNYIQGNLIFLPHRIFADFQQSQLKKNNLIKLFLK